MRKPGRIARKQRGFTLLELMVVMFILVLLAGLVATAVFGRIENAKHAKAIADVTNLEGALKQYYLSNSQYPTTEQGLNALREKPQGDELPSWDGPYIEKAVPNDPWGNPYIYQFPGEHNPETYDLSSLGRDGKEGGSGSDADVTSWE